ncbi:peroxidase, partial [Rhodovulum sulfidophilum]|nr:peroxidase [Rhodovulum sulfidophilum]
MPPPDRRARGPNAGPDTWFAPDLLCLREKLPVPNARRRRLAGRRLHRGLRLNLPSGQGCVAGMARLGVRIAPLSPAELAEGPGGAVLARAGMIEATPLWYYLLREAEARSGGRRLGPLGSRILAETLVGLCVCDPDSYWHHLGSDHGRWHPRDGARPAGEPITTVAALIRAAGM